MGIFDIFNVKPSEHIRMADAQDEHLLQAKEAVLDKLELATVDHTGRRLSKRRWEWAMGLVQGL